ncbi:hypothetical protein XFF6990_80129 [Xanthomonas citri pv. fuscans]|uniref:Uncharacterized protein n=1 Tax=Xanthomonas campestris pv. phaseoli TaxID=317013 RepID=A0A7Z7J3F7_XANCH|nr:hypothetical protein XFF6990_80129 [Xanthomonas citri pv. fuscans]SOO26654.1 hypothetical protein XFF6991_570219 [Xanthomonas phaseoli pv. phaseoli]
MPNDSHRALSTRSLLRSPFQGNAMSGAPAPVIRDPTHDFGELTTRAETLAKLDARVMIGARHGTMHFKAGDVRVERGSVTRTPPKPCLRAA